MKPKTPGQARTDMDGVLLPQTMESMLAETSGQWVLWLDEMRLVLRRISTQELRESWAKTWSVPLDRITAAWLEVRRAIPENPGERIQAYIERAIAVVGRDGKRIAAMPLIRAELIDEEPTKIKRART